MADVDMEELTFDPDQNLEERRSLRQDYRKLASKIEGFQGNPASLGVEELRDHVERADKLFSKVMGPSEATLDSHFLLMASNMGAQKARAMKSGTGSFDVDEFVIKLRNFMNGGLQSEKMSKEDDDDQSEYNLESSKLDWDRIGRLALAKSRRTPALTFMLGPLSVEQKVRNVQHRQRQKKEDVQATKPLDVNKNDVEHSENETTKNVQIIRHVLETVGKVNFFRFVINPNDFAQSVENIFHLSFLIRDGRVAWEVEDSEPFIFPCDPSTDEDYANGLTKQQLVMEFDEELWLDAIKTFNITTSMIPQRPKAKGPSGNKWYG
ncbi:Non-structural maintenance of chromosome element 4 [Leucoagaricus sp. SymC.cos]|nr:Non-structural maintenance of chromosome element 4 [Leucoagaricus sp. SymC.cos]